MKRLQASKKRQQSGMALLMVLMVVVLSAFILGGALQWVSSNSRMNERNNEYYRAVAAAEAATEKAVSMMSRDFRNRDWAHVESRMDSYRSGLPTLAETGYWNDWTFSDPSGATNGIYIARDTTRQFVELDSQYTGLRGLAANYSVIANARQSSSLNSSITVGVRQQFPGHFAMSHNIERRSCMAEAG
jgi:type II secretory pathway component PulJ